MDQELGWTSPLKKNLLGLLFTFCFVAQGALAAPRGERDLSRARGQRAPLEEPSSVTDTETSGRKETPAVDIAHAEGGWEVEAIKGPIDLSAVRGQFDGRSRRLSLAGEVSLTQGKRALHCDQLALLFDEDHQPLQLKAEGSVQLKAGRFQLAGAALELDLAEAKLSLSGGARFSTAGLDLRAHQLTVDLQGRTLTLMKPKGRLNLQRLSDTLSGLAPPSPRPLSQRAR